MSETLAELAAEAKEGIDKGERGNDRSYGAHAALSKLLDRCDTAEKALLEIASKKCLNGNSTCDWPCVVCIARAALPADLRPSPAIHTHTSRWYDDDRTNY